MKPKAPQFNLKQLLDGVAETLESASELLTLGQLLAAHRGQLGHALAQGSLEESRAIVKQICKEHPAVAGVVNYIMTSDVDSAINAVGIYDGKLAETLRANKIQFAQLQQQWSEPPAVAGGPAFKPCGCDSIYGAGCKNRYGTFCGCGCHKSGSR
jgi:hypothetical protein